MTPTQAMAHARSVKFHAEIARRAALVPQKEERSYSIPNTPFGVRKINPMLPVKKPVNHEPHWWHCMWFADLIAVRAPREPGPPPVGFIQAVVARHFGVTKTDLISVQRTQNVVLPRQVAMYLAKVMTPKSYPEIGLRFGGRDHTTVIHSVRKISARCVSDLEFAGKIESIKSELRA